MGWKLMALWGPLQGVSWRTVLPPHPIALGEHNPAPLFCGALAQLLMPWGSPGTDRSSPEDLSTAPCAPG